jgi:hypothetical protein
VPILGNILPQSGNPGKFLKISLWSMPPGIKDDNGVKHHVIDEIGTENHSVGPFAQSGLMPSYFCALKDQGHF